MRTIKFRAWDKEKKEFYYFDFGNIGSCIGSDGYFFRGEITEWTGLTDKNGKEIYEGDLFGKLGGDVERPDEYEIHAKVYFDEDLGAFCIDDNRGGWEYLGDYLLKPQNEKEVIGNIYENPELLK